MKLKEKNRTETRNYLKYTLLIIKTQVVCTKNEVRQKTQK